MKYDSGWIRPLKTERKQVGTILTRTDDSTKLARQTDVDDIAGYMSQLRRTGLTPSDVVSRGLDYADRYVLDEFGHLSERARMKLSAHMWEQAALAIGVHASQRRETKKAE